MSDLIELLRYRHESLYGKDAVPSCISEAADEIERLTEWEARAVKSMDAASAAAGVSCCDLIPQAIERLTAQRDELLAALCTARAALVYYDFANGVPQRAVEAIDKAIAKAESHARR